MLPGKQPLGWEGRRCRGDPPCPLPRLPGGGCHPLCGQLSSVCSPSFSLGDPAVGTEVALLDTCPFPGHCDPTWPVGVTLSPQRAQTLGPASPRSLLGSAT